MHRAVDTGRHGLPDAAAQLGEVVHDRIDRDLERRHVVIERCLSAAGGRALEAAWNIVPPELLNAAAVHGDVGAAVVRLLVQR